MRLALTLLVIVLWGLSGCAAPLLTEDDRESIRFFCEDEVGCIEARTQVMELYAREDRRIIKRAQLMAHIRGCEAAGGTIITIHRGIHQSWKTRKGEWNPPRNASKIDAPCYDSAGIDQLMSGGRH